MVYYNALNQLFTNKYNNLWVDGDLTLFKGNFISATKSSI